MLWCSDIADDNTAFNRRTCSGCSTAASVPQQVYHSKTAEHPCLNGNAVVGSTSTMMARK
eukprot:365673-Chlamydomonas_euryale.AAC.9